MTVVCTACEGQGSHERTATPTEVDNGCELGVAYDECEVCKGRGVVFEEVEEGDMSVFVEPFQTITSASYERITLGPDGTEVRERWVRRPDGSYERWVDRPPVEEIDTLLGVADHDSFDQQAETGQGPPA